MICMDDCCQPEHDVEYTVLSRRTVKASRKVHTCRYCGREIAVGSACYVTNVRLDGQFFSDYRHQVCPYDEE